MPQAMPALARLMLRAKGFPRFASTGTERDLWIDQYRSVLVGYREARLRGGDQFAANRNIIHVTCPAMRARILSVG